MIPIIGINFRNALYPAIRALFIFFIGALSYGTIEVLTRGFTHISMGFLGGISFMFISYTSKLRRADKLSLIQQLIVCALFITTAELLCGMITNLIMGLAIWDYSDMPFNYLGQICLPFSLIWAIITYLGIIVEERIRIVLFHQSIPCVRLRHFNKETATREISLPL